ncbi:Yip1 family protein [Gallaecimonas pentaromativorans]|uniref:Uncharacterized protein DUF1282 n=1 Tax=Gallaecimonas pentaromativorans TaxID=584787 RepID=A0A3N1PSX2_9GAMM|nr:Yip1 family protein [Gallaecimonas pentaromativorans]MED5524118.1 Yip1 family protein [Pseudomonadota bacterium]ROQ29877.1 uncharacterized protein DUF1282 [Gallaecimonas pentaromativorans]
MFFRYIWGFYAHPKDQWHQLDQQQTGPVRSLLHLLLMALIPASSAFYSVSEIGWQRWDGGQVRLLKSHALLMTSSIYLLLIGTVLLQAWLAKWMASNLHAQASFLQTLELVVFTVTPLFMVGLALLYPAPWFVILAGLAGAVYAIYLMYLGVPIMMRIPHERGVIFANALVTLGLVLLVTLLGVMGLIWGLGFASIYG